MPDLAGNRHAPSGRVVKASGYTVVRDEMELLGRGEPGVELLPDELASSEIRGGKGRGLVEPWNDHVAGPSQCLRRVRLLVIPVLLPEGKSMRRSCHLQHR